MPVVSKGIKSYLHQVHILLYFKHAQKRPNKSVYFVFLLE